MTQRIIFVDVDGPLVPGKAFLLSGNSYLKWSWTFDPSAVAMLNFIAWALPDARAVLASHRWGTFLQHPTIPDSIDTRIFWEKVFEQNGINLKFHDDWCTPREMNKAGYYIKRTKAREISQWLNKNPVQRFVTMDDDLNGGKKVSGEMRKNLHLVGEDYDNGLSYIDFVTACNYLGIDSLETKYAQYSNRERA